MTNKLTHTHRNFYFVKIVFPHGNVGFARTAQVKLAVQSLIEFSEEARLHLELG